MGKTGRRDDFEWVYNDQPHTSRRKEILGKKIKLFFLKNVISESAALNFGLAWVKIHLFIFLLSDQRIKW